MSRGGFHDLVQTYGGGFVWRGICAKFNQSNSGGASSTSGGPSSTSGGPSSTSGGASSTSGGPSSTSGGPCVIVSGGGVVVVVQWCNLLVGLLINIK